MIRAFHAFSTLLLMTAIGFILYNLIWQFAANGQIRILSIKELWTSFDKSSFESAKIYAESFMAPGSWSTLTDAPAAMVLLVIAAVFYLPVRILMFMGVGKKAKDWRA